MEKESALRRLTGKVYGGLDMKWAKVLLLAVGSAALTAAFLIVPVFKNTSFERMGVYMEAWVFFAVLIMANCKKPMESALKVFVFFLVSQPLIYLIQVPFSSLGFGLFRFYKYWFILTLLTFPAAWVGWHIRKKNWLSVLIFLPVLALLAYMGYGCAVITARHFPRLLLGVLFCFGQILLYCYVFFPERKQRLLGLLVPALTVAVLVLRTPPLHIDTGLFLPGEPNLTEEAVITLDDPSLATVTLEVPGEDSYVRVQAEQFGTSGITVRDGAREYRYTLEIYEDDGGHTQVNIKEE